MGWVGVQKVQGAEGVASGTTVTAANSAISGDAFSANPTIPAGGTFIFDNAQFAHGTQAFKVATGATAGTSNALQTFAGVATVFFRFYIYATNWTSTQQFGVRVRGSAVQAARVTFDSSGHVKLLNSPNSAIAGGTGTIPLSTATWYRVEGTVTQGAAGTAVINVYQLDSGTLTDNLGTIGSPLSDNFGTNNIDEFAFGLFATTANVAPYWVDDLVINDTGFPGPVVTNTWFPATIVRHRFNPVPRLLRRPVLAIATSHAHILPPVHSRPRTLRPVRGHVVMSPPPQVVVPPAFVAAPVRGRIRFARIWRSRLAHPIATQARSQHQSSRPRLKFLRTVRPHVAIAPIPQVAIPPTFVPLPVRGRIKFLRSAHSRVALVLGGHGSSIPASAFRRMRIRAVKATRSRIATVPQIQFVAPLVHPPQGWRARVRFMRQARGRTAQVVPPQIAIVPAAYVPSALRSRIRFLRWARPRFATVGSGHGHSPAVELQRPRVRPMRPARGRSAVVPPVQVIIPASYIQQPWRLRVKAIRQARAHQVAITPPQLPAAPKFVAQFQRLRIRMAKVFRRTIVTPTHHQAVAFSASRSRLAVVRFVAPKRGRGLRGIPSYQAPMPVVSHSRIRPELPWHGRIRNVVPPQIILPNPPLPRQAARTRREIVGLWRRNSNGAYTAVAPTCGFVPRPNDGTVARPSDGPTTRPGAGYASRPVDGIADRPYDGFAQRTCC